MRKTKPVLLSIVWTIMLLIFLVVSGVIVTVFKMNQIEIFLTQGCFMLLSIIIPIIYVCKKKIHLKVIGLRKMEPGSIGKTLFFIPVVLSELPLILVGVDFKGFTYVSVLIFFTLAVGISEEVYFRGIILKLLKDNFSVKQTIVISALVFGIGHFASILVGQSIVEVLLQIINAIVFGILAAEIVMITKSLFPVIIWHLLFDFVNHISLVAPSPSQVLLRFKNVGS
ncbi:CPBP family intramembrane metalloprotease [Clostridium bowmanii]|uniref:CPBP family intramembrane glutamic endopeptidase n=2 Tax=Clostridium bowmanii TaxID=132925 RepID=UPI001CD1C491|nr:CPBP family intramembrane glutamic endopeptidase [Clostridium bowmanii]MCA1076456.1 CPBP family intramembrane metalloprotease [Clostridium bowmanii]